MVLKVIDNIIVPTQKLFEVAAVGTDEGTEGGVDDVCNRHIVDVAEFQQIHHLVIYLVVLAVVLLDTVAVLLGILPEELPTVVRLTNVVLYRLGGSLRGRWNCWPFHFLKHTVYVGQVEQVVGKRSLLVGNVCFHFVCSLGSMIC